MAFCNAPAAAHDGGYVSSSDRQRGLRSVTQGADTPPAIRQRRTNRSGWVTGGLWLPRTLSPRRKAPPCTGGIVCSGSRAGEAASWQPYVAVPALPREGPLHPHVHGVPLAARE